MTKKHFETIQKQTKVHVSISHLKSGTLNCLLVEYDNFFQMSIQVFKFLKLQEKNTYLLQFCQSVSTFMTLPFSYVTSFEDLDWGMIGNIGLVLSLWNGLQLLITQGVAILPCVINLQMVS